MTFLGVEAIIKDGCSFDVLLGGFGYCIYLRGHLDGNLLQGVGITRGRGTGIRGPRWELGGFHFVSSGRAGCLRVGELTLMLGPPEAGLSKDCLYA